MYIVVIEITEKTGEGYLMKHKKKTEEEYRNLMKDIYISDIWLTTKEFNIHVEKVEEN